MRISLIVAVARNGAIGRAGGLAWRISDDLKRFRALTIGKPVIMGRKTFDSIGKPLDDRFNIVLSRAMAPVEGVRTARTMDEALALGETAALDLGADEICVIGGADVFALALPRADRIHLTLVKAEIDGDVFFPPVTDADWMKRRVGGVERSARNEHACDFFILDRR